MKTCKNCKLTKNLDEFHLNRSYKDGYTTLCKICRCEYYKNKNYPINSEIKEIKCGKCKLIKSVDQFNIQKSRKNGYSFICKLCNSENYKEYYYRSPNVFWKKSLKVKYGITPEIYNNFLLKQESKCKICKIDQVNLKKKLFVDHCHKTGKIRELLCSKCNSLIGMALDNITILDSAIEYLKDS